MSAGLDELNNASNDKARSALMRCCGATRWTTLLLDARPFENEQQLFDAADTAFEQLSANDWLEAFSHHPAIGDRASAKKGGWEAGEQSGAADADSDMTAELAAANDLYRERFGYVFLICATGRSADEMLGQLRERLGNDPQQELANAVREQSKITRLRLQKLLDEWNHHTRT